MKRLEVSGAVPQLQEKWKSFLFTTIDVRCLLSLGAESFFFHFGVQKFKDQDI